MTYHFFKDTQSRINSKLEGSYRSSFLTLKQPSARTTLVLIDASAGEASTTSGWPTRESAKVSFNNEIKTLLIWKNSGTEVFLR